MAKLLAILVLTLPAIALADYVYDGGVIPNTPKTDYVVTSVPATKKITAADFNAVVDGLGSLRLGLLGGYYHGLNGDTAPPTPSPATGVFLFSLLDAGSGPGPGVWVKNPDGSVARLAFQSELPSVAYWNDGGPNNINTIKVTTVPALDAGNINAATETVGSLSTGAFSLNGDLDMSGSSAYEIQFFDFSLSDTAGDLHVNSGVDATAMSTTGLGKFDHIYVPGLSALDGGIDLGVGGTIVDFKSLTASGTVQPTFTMNQSNDAGNTGFTFVQTTTRTTGDALTIINGVTKVFSVPLNTNTPTFSRFGYDFDNGKGINVADGTAATDAVNLQQLGQVTSIAAYAPASVAIGTQLGAKIAQHAGTARTMDATKQAAGACSGDPCSGYASYEVFDITSSTSICAVSMPACCTNTSLGCTSFNNGGHTLVCAGTYAANDALRIDMVDAGTCTANPAVMINFGGY